MDNYDLTYNEMTPINITINTGSFLDKIPYSDTIFLQREMTEYINGKLEEIINDLSDEVIHHLIEEYKVYKSSDGFDYYFSNLK